MNKIKIIDWNISMIGKVEPKIRFIESHLEKGKSTIIVLQEVTEKSYTYIKEILQEFNVEFSLEYRPRGRHEGKNRELGICILYSKEFSLKYGGLLDRLPFPERSLQVILEHFNSEVNIIGFHSVAGCSYKETKTAQFLTLADYVEEENIDFICFDANEPEIDEGDVYKNTYFFQFQNKDKGARTFYEGLDINGLKDGFVSQSVIEKQLPISHIIKSKKSLKRRYDYIFCRKDFKVDYMKYYYEEAVEAGSDHAMLVLEGEF